MNRQDRSQDAPRGITPGGGVPGGGVLRDSDAVSAEPLDSRSGARWLMVLAAITLLNAPWMYGLVCRRLTNCDPFVYASLAKDVLGGKKLYLEAWQDKPPLTILFYALPQLVVPHSYVAIGFFTGICIAIQGLLVVSAFRKSLAAMVGSLLFVTLFPMTNWDYSWPSTEHFANLFVVINVLIAYRIVRDRTFTLLDCILVGVCACAAFHIRQNIVLSGALPGLAILLAPRTMGEKVAGVISCAAGALAMWGLVLGLVYAYGDMRGYFYTVFVYPRAYASAGNWNNVVELARMLWETPLPFIMALFGLISANSRYKWLITVAAVIGILSCVLPMRAYTHYWSNSLPYVALMIGIALQRTERVDRRLAWIYTLSIAVAVLPMTSMRLLSNLYQPQTQPMVRVAEMVDLVAPDNATLMVCGPWNCELIQFSSKLPSANRYSWVNQFQPPWINILPDSLDTIFGEYLASPPTVLVVDQGYLTAALSEEGPPDGYEHLRLVRLLWTQHKYRVANTVEGYVVAVLEK